MKSMETLIIAPVSQGEIHAFWDIGIPIREQRRLPASVDMNAGLPVLASEIKPWAVGCLLADVLERPLSREPRILKSCGRFLVAEYLPMQSADPDILLSLIPNSDAFHETMRTFQGNRQRMSRLHKDWYPNMKKLARWVIAALPPLNVHIREAEFVAAWLLDVICYGRDIPRGNSFLSEFGLGG